MTGLLTEKVENSERERCHVHLLICSYSGKIKRILVWLRPKLRNYPGYGIMMYVCPVNR